MSGIVSGVNYNLLFSGGLSASDASASILTALYSGTNAYASASPAVSTGDPLTDLKLAQANETKDVAKEAKQPQVARDIAAFTKSLASAKDIGTALANPAILKVLLTASNLADQIKFPGMAKKVLLYNPADTSSLVNRLGNAAYSSTVKTYNFFKNGLKALQNPTVIASLTHAYAEVMWRQSLDQATPGLANALAFLNQAKSIKKVDDILGDPINRAVVTTALGIPKQIAFQTLTAQETAITSRINVARLQDPKFVKGLTDQYLLTMKQNAQANAGNTGAGLFTLAEQAVGLVV